MAIGSIAALVLRWTWRDEVAGLAFFYYGTPLSLIWMGLASSSGVLLLCGKPRSGVIAGMIAVACWLAWWNSSADASPNPVEPAPATFRAVFWNTARLEAGWPQVRERISQIESPIMGFVEAGSEEAANQVRWQTAFPDHQVIHFGRGIVLMHQGRTVRRRFGELAPNCYFGLAELEWRGKPLTVLIVDIFSNPFYCRRAAFLALEALIESHHDTPLIVLGDFNTPLESVHFEAMRRNLTNAFALCGNGRAETWPARFPVLSLDQIWVNSQLTVVSARHAWSLESDHRAVIADFEIPE